MGQHKKVGYLVLSHHGDSYLIFDVNNKLFGQIPRADLEDLAAKKAQYANISKYQQSEATTA